MILRIIKRNGKELGLEKYLNEEDNFVEEIKTKDIVVFICSDCGIESRREASKFFNDEKKFCCKNCRISFLNQKSKKISDKKRRETNLRKYGKETIGHLSKNSSFNNPVVREKIRQTNLLKYGTEFPIQNEEIKEKRKKNFIEKHGVSHQMFLEETKEKIKQTNLLRYGDEIASRSSLIRDKTIKNRFKNLKSVNSDKVEPMFSEEEYLGKNYKNKYLWKCSACGNEFSDNIDNGKIPRCLVCNPYLVGTSNGEKEVFEFISSFVKCEKKKIS